MRICVTGGMGYIGSELSLALHKAGHEVNVYDWKLDYPYGELFYAKDFDYDVIYHLAAISGNIACDKYPSHFVSRVNVGSCQYIVNRCRPDTLIIYASTSAIYGKPKGIYAETKLAGEEEILKHKKSVCLRLATIYGVSHAMRPNILVNDLVKSAVQDGYIVIRNHDDSRPYMAIDDCIEMLMWFVRFDTTMAHGEVINAYASSYFASKGKVAYLIHQLTRCDIFPSSKKDKYPQDFSPTYNLHEDWFQSTKPISTDTLMPLVKYYDR